ncbi:MAG: transglutaminase family protein [Deltaproteobacteria bacterium]|nr:transglutaminase family protein [Deltaproteobacteria bacterium]
MDLYLRSTDIIDWKTTAILKQARSLVENDSGPVRIAKICFEWVRDNISHSGDTKSSVTTCRASEVLASGTGWCFAKSHLLAALLRANSIPAGFCYQRLCRDDGNGFTLHGLNAVYLPEIGWYRIDARGNKVGVDAQFSPPLEKLAFLPKAEGEFDFPEIWPDPTDIVVECLKKFEGWESVEKNLPDISLIRDPQNNFLHRTPNSRRL